MSRDNYLRNKDLAPKSALKRLWGNFEGRPGGRTSKLPQSDFYFRARWVVSQFISVKVVVMKKVRCQPVEGGSGPMPLGRRNAWVARLQTPSAEPSRSAMKS